MSTPQADVPGAAPRTTATGGAGVAPKQVNTAFWLYIASAAVSLVLLIIAVATAGTVAAQVQQSTGGKLSGAAVGASITISVIFGILYIAAYVVFAVFMRRGANWARIVLLVVTALSLFGILGGYGVGAVRAVLGVIATILIFIKPASEYFRSGRSARS